MVFFLLCAGIIYYKKQALYYRLPWRVRQSLVSIYRVPLKNLRVYFNNSGQDVEFESAGVKIVGSLFKVKNSKKYPCVILLHDSSRWGRKLALYRILAKKLNEKGYIVLNIDMRGFGSSQDPTEIDTIEAWDFTEDVIQAISYLETDENVDESQIFVVGHSFGGNVAIAAGVKDDRIKKIVAIGPGRRIKERVIAKDSPERDYFQRRFSKDIKLKRLVPINVIVAMNEAMMIDSYLDYFSGKYHKTLFLIDGELESEKDKEFLKNIYEQMKEPKKYITLSGTDHYCDTADIFGIVFYNQELITELTGYIDSWLRNNG